MLDEAIGLGKCEESDVVNVLSLPELGKLSDVRGGAIVCVDEAGPSVLGYEL